MRGALAALAALGVVVLWNAWVCDDAYITFRSADHLLQGFGLRWNVDERVQAFSNPLWLFAFLPVYAVSGDAYGAAVALGVACTLAALALVWRAAVSARAGLLAVALCGLSKAFVDYATSGLENPLAHLLLAALALWLLRGEGRRPDFRQAFGVTAIGSLLVVNRLDAALVAAPAVLALLARRPTRGAFGGIALGGLPLVAWLGFATLYYGFPLPNTAYAKLQNGWTSPALARQGLAYLGDSLAADPLTLAVALAGLAAAVVWRSPARSALAAGSLLHLLYVVRIGGDFMSGRFLTVPFFVGVVLLATAPVASATRPLARRLAIAAAALLALGLLNPNGPLVNPPFWRGTLTFREAIERYVRVDGRGIVDERAFYYGSCGLALRPWLPRLPDHRLRAVGERLREETSRPDATPLPGRFAVDGSVMSNVGFSGFYAGPAYHLVDAYALADAFLARLPPARPGQRIGHIAREVPPAYLESIATGSNRFADPGLRALYERIQRITRAPLWEPERLRLIVEMNLGWR